MGVAKQGWEKTRTPGVWKREGPRGVRYKVWHRDPSGKQRTQTFLRIRDAEHFLHDLAVRKTAGTYVDPALGKVTVGEFADHFLATAHNLRPKTREMYSMALRVHILPALGDCRLNAVTNTDARRFVSDMVAEGKGAATVTLATRVAHRLFQVALEEERIGRNVWSGVKVPQQTRREVRFLTETEVRKIADEVPPRYRVAVWTLAVAGLRIGELAALRVRHVDFERGTIRVEAASAEINGVRLEGATKTAAGMRTVDIPQTLVRMLKEHAVKYSAPLDPNALLFTATRNAPLRQSNFRRQVFQPAARRAGIDPRPRVHDLRHTSASWMGKAGLSLVEAGAMLGHTAQSMTARYSHWYPEVRQAKMQALDALIGS